MNYLDLFAGIGGFALGASWAGMQFEHHFFSEVDPYAIRVYEKRFPTAIGLGDIRGIRGADLPSGDWLLSGGFPCQDISCAGKGAGLAGARSGLWFEYARLIGELRPRYAVMENVGALVGRGLDAVLGSLAEIGYDAEWQDIRASDVGAPHRRERLWIVAYPSSEGVRGLSIQPGRSQLSDDDSLGSGKSLADADSEGLEERESQPGDDGTEQPSFIGGCWWEVEPDVCGMANGIPERLDGGLSGQGMDTMGDTAGESEARVRKVWRGITARLAPSGQGSDEQLARELANALPKMSYNNSLGRGEESLETASRFVQRMRQACKAAGAMRDASEQIPAAWESLSDEEKDRAFLASVGRADWGRGEWLGVQRIAHGIPSRVDRLRCLGNAIVPQIAKLIFEEIRNGKDVVDNKPCEHCGQAINSADDFPGNKIN